MKVKNFLRYIIDYNITPTLWDKDTALLLAPNKKMLSSHEYPLSNLTMYWSDDPMFA